MSRRRAQKQQEKEDFLDQNPELRTFTTRIEVVEVENDGWPVPDNQIVQAVTYGVEMPTFYEAAATQDGEEAFAGTNSIWSPYLDLSLALDVYTSVGDLSAGTQDMPMNEGLPTGETLISLSEDGFGVAQGGGYSPGIQSLGEMLPGNDYALDGDEVLAFRSGFSGNVLPRPSLDSEDDGPIRELGATEFGIDFTVLSGRGTVELVLVDRGNEWSEDQRVSGGQTTVEATSAFLRSGQDGSLDVEMPEGTYDFAFISVTGNLEIAVVGIDVTTNYDFSTPPT